MLIVDAKIRSLFTEPPPLFNQMMALQGVLYRELENRRTQRITLNHQAYFIKQHFGIGWKEIFKNLFQWRLPVLSAKNEWQALQRLHQLHVAAPQVMGYGCQGINPAKLQSFLLTQELPSHISLEDLGKKWASERPTFHFKQQMITEVARIARTLHENGINHRDFYICHLLLTTASWVSGAPVLYIIDLHRAQIRKRTPRRWIIKDLAGLYFSSKDAGLTQRDLLRFIRKYRNKSLDCILTKENAFWQKVKKRGDQLYDKHAR